LERWILQQCDRIIATAEPVASFLHNHFGATQPTLVEVNGVDLELFSQPQPRPVEYEGLRKRCVYVGALDFRFDFDAVTRLATFHPELDFFIIGPVAPERVRGLSRHTNLRFLGSRPHSCLPAYLQHADIGLLPLAPIAANA